MLEFKSNTPNYYPEENGDKSNTVRVVRPSDERRKILDRMMYNSKYGKIRIVHKQILAEHFVRQISNISWFNGCFIISWRTK